MKSATALPVGILAASTLIASLGWAASSEVSVVPPVSPTDVSIGRDTHGVPHVFATTDAGAYYGAGYAAAEDRLFQMCWMRLVVQGRVSEFFGPGTVVNPLTGLAKKTHVISDRKARSFGWSKYSARAAELMDAPTRKLLQAYAEGVNARMGEPGLILDPLFAQYMIPLEPWTPADSIGAWLRLGEYFGTNGLDEAKLMHDWQALLGNPTLSHEQRLEQLLGALVCDDSAAVIQPEDVPQPTLDLLYSYALAHRLSLGEHCLPYSASPHFSQAWAVDGAHTTTGRAMLVGDPRIGVTFPSQLYEWSMQGASFGVRGVGVPGCPNFLSGYSGQVAWSPTAIGLDQSDLLLLRTDPQAHPGQYQLDGNWLDFTATSLETIHVLGESDVLVTYRESYWGPVVTGIVADVHAGEEYAVRRAPFDDPFKDAAAGFVNMYRSASIDAFSETLEGWTWPSVNLVFADQHGRIGYSIAGTVPVRNPKLVLAGVIAQDGSTTSSDWMDVLPQALKPRVLDPLAGFVFSANHRPVGSWYPIPIRYGSGGSGDTQRSRRLRELLGNIPNVISAKEAFDLHFDVVSVAGRDFTELGLWLKNHGTLLSIDARRALQELGPWAAAGAEMDDAVRGSLVVHFMDLGFRLQDAGSELVTRFGGGETGLNLFLKQSLAKIHDLPPVAMTSAEIAYVDRVLSGAVQKAQLIGPTSQWIGWYDTNVLTIQFPKWTSIEGFPSLTPGSVIPVGPFRAVDQNTLLSPLRQSYTQFVEVGSNAPQLTIAPPGGAEPISNHDLDQSTMWQFEQFKLTALTADQLERLGPVHWKHL